MTENSIPKWQQELRAFLGIKSGIILEGNVYDDFPFFDFEDGEVTLLDTDCLDQAILSMVDRARTAAVFFDPVDGFYCYEATKDTQRSCLMDLLEGYSVTETVRDHDQTLCLMPTGRKSGQKQAGGYICFSEVVRRAVSGEVGVKGKENVVFVLNFASRLDACNHSSDEANTMFLNLMAATTAPQRNQLLCNSIILVVDKYNDIPAWVYLNNPNIRTVTIETPDRNIRRSYLEQLSGELAPFSLLSRPDYDAGKRFVAESEGLQLREIRQVLQLAYRKDLKPDDVELAFRLYKYGVLDDPWGKLENDILLHIESTLEKRVKGQNEALQKVKTGVTRAVKGLSGLQHSGASHKPKGIFFFAGPTGVGKTETAKAIAEAIFGDENACIRFDMSEYRLEQSDQKLFGAPPGYVGYEGGGQLTNAVKNRPFSVILFDEIEKASPTIMDKFLQILEDGRMTDNQGNTVYFGETIIIFTSNIGLTKEVVDPGDSFGVTRHRVPTLKIEDPETPDPPEFREKVTRELTEGVKNYFQNIGRPELLNRLGDDNIVVFQFINVEDAKKICDAKLSSICATIEKEKGIRILVDNAREQLHRLAVRERANGGRGVGNMLEREFLNPLANFICTQARTPAVLRCQLDGDGKIVFEVMLDEDQDRSESR